jgi:rod shape-determining protein MreC
MAQRGSSRGRLLLVSLLVSSLFLITLDLRGVSVVSGLRNVTQTLLSPIQSFTTTLFRPIGNFVSDVAHLGRTRSQINSLKNENEKLKSELIAARDAEGKYTQIKNVLDLAAKAQWKVVTARVIAHGGTSTFSQTITIDAGSKSGITRDMSVVAGAGLVGVVKSVTSNSAVVLLMSDPAFRLGVRIAGSQVMGVLSGTGGKNYALQLLDATEDVNLGDQLIARGSDGDKPFVPGVPVGTVTWVDNATGQLTKHANVDGFVKLTSIGIVSVIISTSAVDPRDSLIPPKPKATPTPTVTVTVTPSPSKS